MTPGERKAVTLSLFHRYIYLNLLFVKVRQLGFGGKRGVRGAECGKRGVWKVRSVENEECGKCRTFQFQYEINK